MAMAIAEAEAVADILGVSATLELENSKIEKAIVGLGRKFKAYQADFSDRNSLSKKMPVIDYHCHLPPDEIAQNKQYKNLAEIWLKGDHYKWRAMRTLGVNEHFITGKATDREKFQRWAAAVPYTMRNPLYHWTHMELKNPFGINALLTAENADYVYDKCGEQLIYFTTQQLLKHNNVEVVCTTDDPCGSLEHHIAIQKNSFGTKVLPPFRPDVAMFIENGDAFRAYIKHL